MREERVQLILVFELICNDIIRKVIVLQFIEACHPSSIIECSSIYHISYIISPDFKILLLKVMTLGMTNSHSVAGGVYKVWERIHRCMVDRSLNLYLELSQKNKRHLHKFFYFSHQTKHLTIENRTNQTRLD